MDTLYTEYPSLEEVQDLLGDYQEYLPDLWDSELMDNINLIHYIKELSYEYD